MNNKGILVVISGFSGSGKGTVINALMKKHPDDYAFSISATTRSPRPGEENGVHYFFLNKEEFEEMMVRQGLLTKDLGTILVGEEAVKAGVINEFVSFDGMTAALSTNAWVQISPR